MLSLFATVLLLFGGIVASDDICRRPPDCEDPDEKMFDENFPETREEFKKACTSAIGYMECFTKHQQICLPDYPENIKRNLAFLEIIREICTEDTSLNEAIVDSLPCIKKLGNDKNEWCTITGEDKDRLDRFVEGLSEEGLVSLTDNENDTLRLYQCIEMLNFLACSSLGIQRRCGLTAMNAYVEISQKFIPVEIESCSDVVNLLPPMIRLLEVEEKVGDNIVEALRKKK